MAAGPLALAAGGGDLVARPFADDLALELRERQEHVQHQPAHRRGGVELLRDGHEGDAVLVKGLHHLGEVEQRPAQPVHLVDDHAVDLARLDVGEQPLQGRTFHVAAGEPAIVVAQRERRPAFADLACDVGLARLALSVEGIELLVQPLFRGLAGVDGAADDGNTGPGGGFGLGHFPPSRLKKRKPLQCVPVTLRATAESVR